MSSSPEPELPPALRPQSNKRKRIGSHSDHTSQRSRSAGSDTINPRSHSPSTIRQLFVAGVPIEDDNPTQHISKFPHRGLPPKVPADNAEETEWTDGGETSQDEHKKRAKPTPREALTGHSAILLRLIYENLDRGDIDVASRFYGHLLQLRDRGRPISIRQHNLWAIGAEILMREGERPAESHDAYDKRTPEDVLSQRRWGRAANMPKVRAYYDTLIREFPFDYRFPKRTDAMDFWLALIHCEFYNTYTEQALALERLKNPETIDPELESLNDDASDDGEDNSILDDEKRRKRVEQRKEDVRKNALSTMEGLAARMDELMSEPPYSKDDEFKRLRAMLSLYIADLMAPHSVDYEAETRAADVRKGKEQDFARHLLQKVKRNGYALNKVTMKFVDPEGEMEEAGHVYSSLPIRGV